MSAYDVVVVGGGIGGLTVAALLSARGLNTCLLERQSQVGGCIARVEFSGYDFEPGMGLYTSFGAGEVYDQLFSQLPVAAPEVSLLSSPYILRRADRNDVTLPTGDLYAIVGGPATLAERLAESIKQSGGNLRLNSPVLRLAYDESGRAIGIDLLSGERVFAKKAIVSNLTIWDTYGKLVGLNRTPAEIKKRLSTLHGTGVYVVYAAIEESAITRLPAELMRVEDGEGEFTLAISSSGVAPPGKRAVTFTTRTEIDSWFAYQSSEEDYEQWDQDALEHFWTRLHTALPELGSDIEVIETANPRTYYDSTRRKLGMVLGIEEPVSAGYQTSIPNVFMVGDTVVSEAKANVVAQSALDLQTLIV
ncbi:MAG TPA: FAD-dependent oxidoreductase [Pyrinomonadaceae bacterium]|nr:FAD-dependent oxidoreductase [Pyrinomonadaceae bacterium]